MDEKNQIETSKRVTMKDIAKEAGISLGTVDRAFNNRGRISKATREKIIEIAKELNYSPNEAAKRLSMRKRFKILVIMPISPNWFWDDVNKGVKTAAEELQDFGVEVSVFRNDYSTREISSSEVLEMVKENDINGILAVAYGLSEIDEILAKLDYLDIPIAFFSEDIQRRKGIFFYGTDKFLSGKMAGDLMGMILKVKDNSKICMLHMSQRPDATKRMQSFYAQIYRYHPHVEGIDTLFFDKKIFSDPDKQGLLEEKIMDDLASHEKLDGIYIPEVIELDGLSRAIKKINSNRDIAMIAHEASYHSKELLIEGYIDSLICEDKFFQGYYPLKLMYEYLLYGLLPEEREIYSNTNIVMRSNLTLIEQHERDNLESNGELFRKRIYF